MKTTSSGCPNGFRTPKGLASRFTKSIGQCEAQALGTCTVALPGKVLQETSKPQPEVENVNKQMFQPYFIIASSWFINSPVSEVCTVPYVRGYCIYFHLT